MENLDNIFSIPTVVSSHNNVNNNNNNNNNNNVNINDDDTSWLLQQSIIQNQDDIFGVLNNVNNVNNINNNNNNFNNNETFNNSYILQPASSTSTTSSLLSPPLSLLNNVDIKTIKEQEILLEIQKQKQLQQFQMQQQMQQLQNFQIQQQHYYENYHQQPQPPQFDIVPPCTFGIYTSEIQQQQQQLQLEPILDQQLLLSMKPISILQTNNNNNNNNNITTTTTTTTTNTNTNTNITDTTKTTDSNKKIIIDQDKEEKKKKENRNYHKKFREKKKDKIKEIENQIAALTFENEQIRKQNYSLKNDGEGVETMLPASIEIYDETMKILDSLKEALEKDDEISILYYLPMYQMSFTKLYHLCQQDSEKLFYPNVQNLLAMISYECGTEPVSYNIISGPDSDLWIDQFKEEAELSNDQILKFDDLRRKYHSVCDELLRDRLALDKEVKQYLLDNMLMIPRNPLDINDNQPYKTDLSLREPLEMCSILRFVYKLNSLKNKVFKGRSLLLDKYLQLGTILTPKQEAMFHVRIYRLVYFNRSGFRLLNHIWTNLMSSKSVFNIAENIEKMVYTGNISMSLPKDTTPFSLKPATFNPPNSSPSSSSSLSPPQS